jgi:hypothetical protein
MQVVPEEIYNASYPCRFFNKAELIERIEHKYECVAEFASYCDPLKYTFEDGKVGTWLGIHFKISGHHKAVAF